MNRFFRFFSVLLLSICTLSCKDGFQPATGDVVTGWDELAQKYGGSKVSVEGHLDAYWHDETTSFTVLREKDPAGGEAGRHLGLTMSFALVPESITGRFILKGTFTPDESGAERVGTMDVQEIQIVGAETE